MASRGRPKAELVLTEEERETLTRWARRRTSSEWRTTVSSSALHHWRRISGTVVAAHGKPRLNGVP
jgi:hypothetical protein